MRFPQGAEWLIILVLILLLFGAKRLPDMARSLGRSARILKSETKGLRDDETADDPAQAQGPAQAQTPALPASPPVAPPAATPVAPPAAESAQQPPSAPADSADGTARS